MKFLVVGINHRTAPISVREQITFSPEELVPALCDIALINTIEEVTILSTCNRTEVYVYGTISPTEICAWLSQYHRLTSPLNARYFYTYTQQEAISHAMRVASGLDSLIIGEPQILGQLKSAYAVSQTANTLSNSLEQMFQETFATAKKVRTNTAIGQSPVSVAYAAVQLAQQIFTNLSTKTALLIGAGKTIELAYKHLRENKVKHIIVANRTQARAHKIAEHAESQAILLGEIPELLHKADIVIASTASQLPILGKGAVEKALKKRKHSPILMVDIAVPRDIEPEVESLSDVYLYSVDDLNAVIQDNLDSRLKAAKIAEQIIFENTENFFSKLRERSAASILKLYRQQAESIRDQEVSKALKMIAAGKPLEQVLIQLANNITNKLIHSPCVNIRKASGNGDTEKMSWAQDLLGLPINENRQNHETIYN